MKKRIISAALIFVFAFMFCFSGVVSTRVVAVDPTPDLEVKSVNLNLAESVYIKFFVETTANLELNVWHNADGSDVTEENRTAATAVKAYNLGTDGSRTVFGVKVNAKEMADNFYVQATDGTNVGGVKKYSVLQYAMTVLADEEAAASMKTLVTEMLSYGAAAQDHFNHNEARPANGTYYTLEVKGGGTLPDGTTKGLYLSGSSVTLTAPATVDSKPFVSWRTEGSDYDLDTLTSYTVTVSSDAVYVANYTPAAPVPHVADIDFSVAGGIVPTGTLPVSLVGSTGTVREQLVTYGDKSAVLPVYATDVGQFATLQLTALTDTAKADAFFNGGFSIEAFYFMPIKSNYQGVVCAASSYTEGAVKIARGWGFAENAGKLYSITGKGATGAWDQTALGGVTSDNKLVHVVVVYDADPVNAGKYTQTIYVDGNETPYATINNCSPISVAVTGESDWNKFCLGASYNTTPGSVNKGMIMVDAKIYDYALDAEEVVAANTAAADLINNNKVTLAANTATPYVDFDFNNGVYDRLGKATTVKTGSPSFATETVTIAGSKTAILPVMKLETSDYVTCTLTEKTTKASVDSMLTSFTIEAFYLLDDKSGTQGVICCAAGAGSPSKKGGWCIAEKEGIPYSAIGHAGNNYYMPDVASQSSASELVHVVTICEQTGETEYTVRIIQNGNWADSVKVSGANAFAAYNNASNANKFCLGNGYGATGSFPNKGMTMVDAKLYTSALTEQQVTAAYNNAVSPFRS